jgi:hypothetical protein
MFNALKLTGITNAVGVKYHAVTDSLLPVVDAFESLGDLGVTMFRSMNTGEMIQFRSVMHAPYDSSSEYAGQKVFFAHTQKREKVALRINMERNFLRRVEYADPTSGMLEWKPLIWKGYTQLVLPTLLLEKIFDARCPE